VQQRLWDSCTGIVHPRNAWQQSQECWVPRKAFKVESKFNILKVSCYNSASHSTRSRSTGAAQPLAAAAPTSNETGLHWLADALDLQQQYTATSAHQSNNANVRAAAQRKQRQCREVL